MSVGFFCSCLFRLMELLCRCGLVFGLFMSVVG